MPEEVVDDLVNGIADDGGFTPSENVPLSVVALVSNSDNPLESVNKPQYHTLKGCTSTRWHSVLTILESLGCQKIAVNRLLFRLNHMDVALSEDQWTLVQQLIKFLKIFRSAVEMFSKEISPSLSSVLVFRTEIEASLKPCKNDHPCIAHLKINISLKLDYRFPITDEIIVASLLDPRQFNLKNLTEELRLRDSTRFEFLRKILLLTPSSSQKSYKENENLSSIADLFIYLFFP